jgi:two-component system NtrC family sensor kinase
MMERIRELFMPAAYEKEEKARVARLLNAALLTNLAAAIFLIAVVLALYGFPASLSSAFTLLSAITVGAAAGGLLVLAHYGHLRIASLGLLFLLWVIVTCWIWAFAGISSDSSSLNYFIVIVLAGLLLGGRAAMIFTLASMLAVLGGFYAEASGLLIVTERPLTALDLVLTLVPMVLIGLMLRYAVNSMTAALERAGRNERAQLEANRDLQAIRSSLEQQIAERERVEEAIRANEARFRALVENAFEAVYIITADGAISYVSPSQSRPLGWSAEELIGRQGMDWLDPVDFDSIQPLFTKILNSPGQPITGQMRARHKDGSRQWIEVTACNLLELAAVRGIVVNLRNITERKRAEDAVRQAEQRYRNLFEQAPVMYVITRSQDQVPLITDCNREFLSALGYDRDQVVGRPLAQFYTPESRGELEEGGGYRRALEGQFLSEERQLVTCDGRIVETLLRAVPETDANGNVVGTRAMYVDITDQKQAELARRRSEEMFRGFVVQSFDGILLVDEQGRIIEWNTANEQITGLARSEAMGQFFWDVQLQLTSGRRQTPDMSGPYERSVLEALRTGQAPWLNSTTEVMFQHVDGSQRIVQQAVFLIEGSTGRRIGAVLRDVTKARQVEAEARQRTAQMMAVRRLGFELAANLELESLLSFVARQAAEIVGSTIGGVYLYRPEQDALERVVGFGRGRVPIGTLVRRGQDVCGRVLETGESLVIGDYTHWKGRLADYDADPIGAVIGIPIRWGDEFLGVLDVAVDVGAKFSPDDVELLTLFASQAAVAIKNAQLFEEAQRRARDLEAINRASREMMAMLQVDKVLSILTERAHALLKAGGAAVLLHDGGDLVFAAVSGSGADVLAGTRLPATAGIAGAVLQGKQPVWVADARADSRFYDGVDTLVGQTTRSLVAAPLIFKDKIWGVLEAIHFADNVFTRHDLATLQALSNSATAAIENAQLYQAERDQREFAETLRQVGSAVIATLDMEAVLDRLLEQIGRVVPNDAADIMLIEGEQARIVRHRGYERWSGGASIAGFTVRIGDLAGLQQIIRLGEPLVVSDTHASADWVHFPQTEWIRSWAAAPIRIRGKTLGFLNANSATPGFFQSYHAGRLRAFADQAAIAIENARLYQVLQEQYRRLQESQGRLIQAEKMSALGRLTASIAHEINNPLQAVQSCLSLIKEELDEGGEVQEIYQDLGIASSEVARVASILRRLRDFYRPAHEGTQQLDLHELMRSVLELISKQLQRSHVTVECEWTAELPLVMGNLDHLKQVLVNLMLNAIDAIGEQSGVIRVRTALDEMPGADERRIPAVRVEISDTGAGMPPEILSRLFEPFLTTKPDGTGLGLYISYEIIRAHDGLITVTSQMGQGTAFTILLPHSRQS